ncbi:MAG: hypothetical protein P8Y98_15265 [Anaerolineales bacterium]|jgi:hypothetical protein
MPDVTYRLFFNDEAASQEQLNRVEEITVEQRIDAAWEARLQIPVCLDENGNWQGDDEDFMISYSAVRVEIKIADQTYQALIDGPVVGFDTQRSSEPGQSSITLIVHDDSAFLNQEEALSRFDNMADHEVAQQLFGGVARIGVIDVETTPDHTGGLPAVIVQRGTGMQILRTLARRQGMHAYVLPGEDPGQSVGCFKRLPAAAGDIPDLVILGAERNVSGFNLSNNAQSPAQVQASALRVTDKGVVTRTSSFRDLDLLGDQQAQQTDSSVATMIALPRFGTGVDLDRLVEGQSERASYAYSATGSIIGECYSGVLLPYNLVNVTGTSDEACGEYLIHQVRHQLTRSVYGQSFTLKRNARSSTGGGSSASAGSIY